MVKAAFRLAEIESGSKDLNMVPELFIDDGGNCDPIGHRLYQIGLKVGPNYWTEKAMDKYLVFFPIMVETYHENLVMQSK
jgi:hypothetical protein